MTMVLHVSCRLSSAIIIQMLEKLDAVRLVDKRSLQASMCGAPLITTTNTTKSHINNELVKC